METELLPGIHLTFDVTDADDADRFRRTFISAWESMPTGIRRVLKSHWTKHATGPLIEFAPFDWDPKQGNVAARVMDGGFRVQFNQYVFNRCEAALFQTAVAHELSHVFFIANNQPQHIFMFSIEDKLTTELLAFELTRRMGFPQDRFFEWINCSMSTQGPFLRSERGEQDSSPDDFWSKWGELENRWKKAFRPDESLDRAKADLYSEHARFFDIALEE